MIFMAILHRNVEKDLINRLMARNLQEYKQITNPEPVVKEEAPKELTNEQWKQAMSDMYDGKVG